MFNENKILLCRETAYLARSSDKTRNDYIVNQKYRQSVLHTFQRWYIIIEELNWQIDIIDATENDSRSKHTTYWDVYLRRTIILMHCQCFDDI